MTLYKIRLSPQTPKTRNFSHLFYGSSELTMQEIAETLTV
ncbi:hypothetical protein CKA32_005850 [Geitlerinema sp. FC II]|nr:hypothetical protein CKA32_005850 [Geitlerinema sp. FC II]